MLKDITTEGHLLELKRLSFFGFLFQTFRPGTF